jgi:hypothetical protein
MIQPTAAIATVLASPVDILDLHGCSFSSQSSATISLRVSFLGIDIFLLSIGPHIYNEASMQISCHLPHNAKLSGIESI